MAQRIFHPKQVYNTTLVALQFHNYASPLPPTVRIMSGCGGLETDNERLVVDL